jgi:hypothetical protein
MKKRILFLYYSQAGQTDRAMKAVCLEASSRGFECEVLPVECEQSYEFPWSMGRFFRVFPLCVAGVAPQLKPPRIQTDYDLIVLGYQVWFLSPSLPVQSLLQSAFAEKFLRDKPVITVCTCRNLWYSAARSVTKGLETLGANWVANHALCERSPLWASFVTTPRWMLTGRRNAFAFFPPAGILEDDFSKFSKQVVATIQDFFSHGEASAKWSSNLDRLSLRWMDKIGRRFFEAWVKGLSLVAPHQGRWQDCWLVVFRLNLIAVILSVGLTTKLAEVVYGRRMRSLEGFLT